MKRHSSHTLLSLVLLALLACCSPKGFHDGQGNIQMKGDLEAQRPSVDPANSRTKKRSGDTPDQVDPLSGGNGTGLSIVLGRPTDSSITASLYSRSAMQVSLIYGQEPDSPITQNVPIDLESGIPQNIELTGLAADAAYFYKVTQNGMDMGMHTFHTQRSPGSAYAFTVDADPHFGDPKFNGSLYKTTLNNALADHPDFHIDLGDTFMTEKLAALTKENVEATFEGMRPYFGILGSDVPLYLVNGNHEGELGWFINEARNTSLPLWSTESRQKYYPNPRPGGIYTGSSSIDSALGSVRDSYYSWQWGDALFIVLDPFWYTTVKPVSGDSESNWNWTLGREQYDWLKDTLGSSQALYRFVFIHHLVGGGDQARGGMEVAGFYEWGGQSNNGSRDFDVKRPGWGKPIHQLLVENGVDIVFHGHDHFFARQELDGIIYQEVPQPANAEYDRIISAAEYGYVSGDILGSSGHLRVSVSPEQVEVAYIRAYLPQDETADQKNGEVAFQYVLSP